MSILKTISFMLEGEVVECVTLHLDGYLKFFQVKIFENSYYLRTFGFESWSEWKKENVLRIIPDEGFAKHINNDLATDNLPPVHRWI